MSGRRALGAVAATVAALGVLLALPAGAFADFTATEGNSFTQTLESTEIPCPATGKVGMIIIHCDLLHASATVNWGDGSAATSAETVAAPNADGKPCADETLVCRFNIVGSHTYFTPGTYSGSISVGNGSESEISAGTFTATVVDAPITLSNVQFTRTGQSASVTATLTDGDPEATSCSYTASIDWGDSTGAQTANVSPVCAQAPSFTVSGTHTYAAGEPTSDQATVTVIDSGGSIASKAVTIPFPPDTETLAASNVSDTSATLNASINSLGGDVQSCTFEWGATAAYGNTAPCSAITQQKQLVSAALTGLSPTTTYHYRVDFKTDVGAIDGDDMTFTTLAKPASGAPTVVTGSSEVLSATSAELDGQVNPNAETLSDCHFEYGTTTAYGSSSPCTPATVAGNTLTPVQSTVTGLTPDTTYHYRLVAANPGSAASDGADATFTTRPDCNVTAKVGYMEVSGCLSHTTADYVSTEGSTVSFNGLTLVPDQLFTTITFDPSSGTISSDGPVSVQANGSGASVVIFDGRFSWTEGAIHTDDTTVPLATITPPPLTKVAGASVDGELAVSLTKGFGTQISANAQLPLGQLIRDVGLGDGKLTLATSPGTGLVTNQLQITASGLQIEGIGLTNVKVSYQPGTDTWSGGATIGLPAPIKYSISASLAVQHGSLQKFSGSIDGLNIPVGAGISLQRISVTFGDDPLTIGGGIGLSFGPDVGGNELARVDGDFVYQEATPSAAGFIDVDGSVTLASIKIANAYFDYYTSGLVEFGGGVSVGLPDTSSANASKQPVYFSAGVKGAVQGSAFDVDVNTSVKLNFIDLSVGAEVLLSDRGIAGCAKVGLGPFTWSPGFGYNWGGGLTLMPADCSVGPWETLKLGQAGASSVGRRVLHLGAGKSLIELTGLSAEPKVTLHGPHGAVVHVPLHSVKPVQTDNYTILQDPTDKKVWIALRQGAGTWAVVPENDNSAIKKIRVAGLLPSPRVTAHVTGTGRKRTLVWSLRPIPGQRVVFWEKGKDVGHIIGATTKAHGKLHFTPAPGYKRARTIEAQVFSNGKPRTDLTVAHYSAPAPPKPAKVTGVTVTAVAGGALRVSWHKAANAAQYRIEVLTGDGSHLVQMAGAKARSIVIHDVVPITAAQVTINGQLGDGVVGPAARVTFPAPAHTVKPKPKHKPAPKKHKPAPKQHKAA